MAGYIGPIPVPQATQTRETFTATASQTTFNTAGYQPGYLDVFMNGVKLIDGSDYTATNGSDVVLSSGAAINDLIEVVAYTAFEVLNQNFTGTTTVADLTVTGDLTVDGTTTTINSTTLNVDDINITVASGAADAAAANGAGLTVDGANATFNYASSGDKWTMNKDLDITGDLFVPSGNLLVGKTSSAFGTEGVEVRPDALWVTRDSDTPVFFNRETTDGQILNFSKNTGTVGSIGTKSSGLFIGSDDAGIFFNDHGGGDLDAIYPYDVGTNTFYNGHVDIGGASNRFKDLYLSSDINQKTTASEILNHSFNSNRSGAGQTIGRTRYYWNGNETARIEALTGADTTNKDDGALRFLTSEAANPIERMRLLSTGSILFGQTTSDRPAEFTQPTGAAISGANGFNHGQYQSSVNGLNMLLNRKGTQGDIVGYRYNGADVGSFGYASSGISYLSGSATGVGFGSATVYPTDGAGNITSSKNLGSASYPWKDLYLSGGIQFDSRSNKLDDYEEGVFSASMVPSTSGTITLNGGVFKLAYTKVGRKVHVQGLLETSAKSSPVGRVEIRNLPFAAVDGEQYTGRCGAGMRITNVEGTGFGIGDVYSWYILEGGTTIYVDIDASTVHPATTPAYSQFYISVTYMTA